MRISECGLKKLCEAGVRRQMTEDRRQSFDFGFRNADCGLKNLCEAGIR
ncbi:hypothetical protein D1AOALGA4SA_9120 [Olavius algarvensis Delta 1 endosymbiont]|nr:hypothetical protein D1AOALGA4SA_9120 [Olavius algarvensis Delta 1 endosymbiont]